MKRRSLKWFVLSAVLGVASFACYLWVTCGSGGVNRMSVLRIRPGMSSEEVEAVIGPHSGNHSTSLFAVGIHDSWEGNAGTITVWFDRDGKVTERHFHPLSKSLFDSVYRWMGIDAK